MKEASFYQKKINNTVKCDLCAHFCVIKERERGLCGVRINEGGILKNIAYGHLSFQNIETVEKKPLYHFFPGSRTYAIGSWGCNLQCRHCNNYSITEPEIPRKIFENLDFMTPERIVEEAIGNDCSSIAYTYNEPTLNIEYYLEIMRLAQMNNLQNIWVSNGYMGPEALSALIPHLNAASISLKSLNKKFYHDLCAGKKFETILENIKILKREQIHLEISTLVIPSYNDEMENLERIAEFIAYELDGDTPWHIIRFLPGTARDLNHLSATGEDVIYEACEIGGDAGLKYVYVNNLPGDQKENTYCPKCKELVIRRFGQYIERLDKNGHCPECDRSLDIVESGA